MKAMSPKLDCDSFAIFEYLHFKNIPSADLKVYLSGRYPDDIKDLTLAVDLVMKMLRWIPSDRIKALVALEHPFLSNDCVE